MKTLLNPIKHNLIIQTNHEGGGISPILNLKNSNVMRQMPIEITQKEFFLLACEALPELTYIKTSIALDSRTNDGETLVYCIEGKCKGDEDFPPLRVQSRNPYKAIKKMVSMLSDSFLEKKQWEHLENKKKRSR